MKYAWSTSLVGVICASSGCFGPSLDDPGFFRALADLICESGGCYGPSLDDLGVVPAGVAAADRMQFELKQPADHPLLNVPPGAVMDDLAGLAGCWGAFSAVTRIQGSGASFETISERTDFFQFDLDAGQMTHQLLHRLSFPGDPILEMAAESVSESIYSVAIPAPDHVSVVLRAASFNTTFVGPQEVGQINNLMAVPAGDPVDLSITLLGDAFTIRSSDDVISDLSVDFRIELRSNLVYLRIECPN